MCCTTTLILGFKIPIKEQLLILKQFAEIGRANSPKGEKDRIDILSLLFFCDIDFKLYHNLVKEINKKDIFSRLKNVLSNFNNYKYFNYTPRTFKIKKNEILERIKNWM